MTSSSCCSSSRHTSSSNCCLQIKNIICNILATLQTLVQLTRLYAKVNSDDLTAALVLALDDEHRKLGITIDNRTSKAIYVSFDGINVHDCIAAGVMKSDVFGPSMRYEINKIYLAYVEDPASGGWVTITAWY